MKKAKRILIISFMNLVFACSAIYTSTFGAVPFFNDIDLLSKDAATKAVQTQEYFPNIEYLKNSLDSETEDFNSDASSIDVVLKALYESITFTEGKEPDLARFRNLFAAGAPCIRLNKDDTVDRMTLDSFIFSFKDRIAKGMMKSFHESEIARKTQKYGRIAQVFSTYQKGINITDPAKYTKGINSLQLFYDSERWWIGSLLWMDERSDLQIPPEYLK